MFIIEWINDYMNTPAMDMTPEIETLGVLAIVIIFFIAAVIVWAGALVWRLFGKLISQRKRKER